MNFSESQQAAIDQKPFPSMGALTGGLISFVVHQYSYDAYKEFTMADKSVPDDVKDRIFGPVGPMLFVKHIVLTAQQENETPGKILSQIFTGSCLRNHDEYLLYAAEGKNMPVEMMN